MLQTFVKNTFLTLESPEETILRREAYVPSDRARSLGPLPSEAGLMELDEEQEIFMHRLNTLLECDRSTASELLLAQSLRQESLAMTKGSRQQSSLSAASSAEEEKLGEEGTPTVDELRELQRRLSELAGAAAKLSGGKLLGQQRVMSNSSVSTMASQEDEGAPQKSPMQKVWSSGSVSTMVSDVWDDPAEFDPIMEEEGAPLILEAPKSGIRDFTHARVPRTVNLAEEFLKSEGEPPTTMMVRNIPNRYTQRDLIRELEKMGFAGTFDFLYLPIDKGTMCNVGYAFVNFVDASWAAKCMELLENYHFKKNRKGGRGKFATVSVAHIQGLEANVKHYEKSAVNVSSTPRLRQRGPVIVASIEKSLQ